MVDTSIVLNNKEISYLAALTGAKEFLGIQDKMFTWSEEEINREWLNVQRELEDKQYIELGFDGSVTMDEVIYSIIHTCCNCELYGTINRQTAKDGFQEFHYYITRFLLIEMTPLRDTSDEYVFTFSTNPVATMQSIIEKLPVQQGKPDDTEPIVVAESLLQNLKKIIQDKEEAMMLLTTNGYSSEFAIELIGLLGCPSVYMSLILMQFKEQNRGKVTQLTLIKSEQNLWNLEPIIGDQVSYKLIPLDHEQTLVRFTEWFAPVTKVYEYGGEI